MQEQNRFGVRITGVGTFTEEDMTIMRDWHKAHEILEDMADLIMWVRSSKYDRINLPGHFNDSAQASLLDFTAQLEDLDLNTEVTSMFGPICTHELRWFRRDVWFEDASFKLVMGYLVELSNHLEGMELGCINPMYAHISDEDEQKRLIAETKPFEDGNNMVLLPMWIDAHWCAAVFDFREWSIIMFDPMQKKAYYDRMEEQIKALFPSKVRRMEFKRVTCPYQEDICSCGLYCLVFFECQVRGIPMPNLRPRVLGYLRFRYLYKACLGHTEWADDS